MGALPGRRFSRVRGYLGAQKGLSAALPRNLLECFRLNPLDLRVALCFLISNQVLLALSDLVRMRILLQTASILNASRQEPRMRQWSSMLRDNCVTTAASPSRLLDRVHYKFVHLMGYSIIGFGRETRWAWVTSVL